jgi:hypothetical protein
MEAILIQPKNKTEFNFIATMLKKLNIKIKTITLEEEIDTTSYLMSNPANKKILEQSMLQDKNEEYIAVKNKDL